MSIYGTCDYKGGMYWVMSVNYFVWSQWRLVCKTCTHPSHTHTHSHAEAVAEVMSDAMNRLDENHALKMFNAMMSFMRASTPAPGRCEVNFHDIDTTLETPPTFM